MCDFLLKSTLHTRETRLVRMGWGEEGRGPGRRWGSGVALRVDSI